MSTWDAPPLPARWSGPKGPVFVGRRRQFEVLEEVWEAVGRGSRQVVFVGGEAGVGKSRLIQVVGTTLHAQGAAVLLGSTRPDLAAPYEPLVAPIVTLRDALGRGELELGSQDDPETVQARLAMITGTGGLDQAQGRIPVYDAVVAALRSAAGQRPVVLVLEDLHWAGASALELLTHVGERCDGARLLVLASHRSTPPDRSEGLVDAIGELYRTEGVRRLDLEALDTEEIAEYLAREAGIDWPRARRLAARLRDRTGGNAFYLREVVREWARPDAPGAGAGIDRDRVPDPVRDTVGRRLARLHPSTRLLVELGAVVGDDFTLPLVAAAAGLDAAEALQHAEDAVAQALVQPQPAAPEGYRFAHELARAAVLELMPAPRRVAAHAAVARCLETEFPASPLRVERLAHHYFQSHVLGHAEAAVRYLTMAAEDARSRLAHLEAGQHLERAGRLTRDGDDRDALLLRAAQCFRDGGRHDAACALAREVALQGDPTSRLQAAVVYEGASWRVGGHAAEAVDLLARCLEVDQVDPALLVRARASLARALVFTGQSEEATELGDRCVDEARSLEDPATTAHVLETVVMLLPRPARLRLQLARARELSDLAARLRDHDQAVQAASITTMLTYLAGDLAGVEAARAALVRASRLTGSTFHLMEVNCHAFSRALAAGDLAGAAAHSARLAEVTHQLMASAPQGAVALQGFLLRRERDRIGEVAGLVSGHEDPAEQWAPGLLALYTELGMQGPARRVLLWMLERLPDYSGSSTWPASLAFLAEAAVHLGDHESGRRVVPLLQEFSGHHLAVGPLAAVFGSADRYLGSLQSMLGHAAAGDLLRGAVEQDRSMDAALFTGYSLARLSLHLDRTTPGSRAAREAREEAVSLARARALPRLLRVLDARDDVPADGLTPREVEVLRLLAQGLGNRELARRLFIAENTATNHVRSILLKTGSANRTQAALYAAARGLVAPPRPR